MIIRTISYWCFSYKNDILEIIIVLFILMSELRGQYSLQAARESFENQTQRIQQSLKDLAEQAAEAKYRQQLSNLRGKYEEAERQRNALRRQVQGLKKNSQEIARIQQKQKELQKRQRQTKNHEALINDQLIRQSKQAQILRLQQKLRQDFHNLDLQNKFKSETKKMEGELRTARSELEVKAKQLQRRIASNAALEERLKSLHEEMGRKQARFNDLQQQHQTQVRNWQQEIKRLDEAYAARAKQFESALQASCASQISQRQGKIKNVQAELKSQRQAFDNTLQQANRKVLKIQSINKDLQAQLASLRQDKKITEQKYQQALLQVSQLKKTYSQQLQNERNAIQAHFNQEITRNYDQIAQRIKDQVDIIKKQQEKLIAQKQQSYNTEIQKLKERLEQQRQQSSKAISNFKIQIDQIRREQLNRRQQEQRLSNSKIGQLQTIIGNLSNIILDRSFKAVDHATILKAIEDKISHFKNQLLDLNAENAHLLGVNKTLDLHIKQIRQWFRNISALLNSSEAATVLQKGQKYDIGDEDVLQSINSFTAKLQSRLNKHKTQQETQQQQIGILRQQISKIKKAKDEVDRTVTTLSDKIHFLEGQLRKASLERQSAQKSMKQHTSTIIRLEDQIKQLQSSLAQKQADIICLKEQISTIQNVKIVGYTNRIHQQAAKNYELSARLKKSEGIIANLQEQKRALSQSLSDRKAQNEERLQKLQEMKRKMITQQKQWTFQRQSELVRFRGVINQLFDTPEVDNTFDGMLNYIKNHKSGSEAGPFVVSTIFETAPKERGLLQGIVCKFMQCKSIKATFLYKYDEFNKNFANYLPIKSSYDFVLLAKTKKSQIFGVISIGLGPKSRALAFNLNSGKTFPGDPSMSSTTYDGSYLLFGQSEIRIKNNSILQLVVTTRIFNARYFSFMKEELVGVETGESVLLDALEIHRIDY